MSCLNNPQGFVEIVGMFLPALSILLHQCIPHWLFRMHLDATRNNSGNAGSFSQIIVGLPSPLNAKTSSIGFSS